MKIKIMLVEDQHIIRTGLRVLIESQPAFEVVGETDNGVEAVELAQQLMPDVILMDIRLQGSEISGIQATRKITALSKDIKIIALSQYEEIPYVKGMLTAGAVGYLPKVCTEDTLMEAIREVMQGGHYFSKGAAQIIQEDYINMVKNPHNARRGKLSERELEVVRLIAQGENSKTIAGSLNLSPKTVDAHRRNAMDKLKLNSIADLIKYAIREKIIQENE